jgi:hypothetical protein
LFAVALVCAVGPSCAGPERTAVRFVEDAGVDASAGPERAGSGGRGGGAGSMMAGGQGGGSGGSGGAGGGAGSVGASGAGGTGGLGGGGTMSPRDMAAPSIADMAIAPPDVAAPRDVAMEARPPDASGAFAPGSKKVLLVVENPATVVPGDMKVRQRLEAKMFMVTLGDDDNANADGRGMGMVVISNSVRSSKVAGRFRDVPIPVICMEAFVFKDMRMTSTMQATDFDDETATQITITRPGHMLAAGLMGTVTVAMAAQPMSWGKPGAGAETVATVANQAAHAAIFGYPTGAMMVGQSAPARRVGLFASEPVAARLTADGEKLLDAAIDWASR